MCCTSTATKIKPRPACECLIVVQQCRTTLERGTASAAPAAPSTPALVHVCVRVYVCASVYMYACYCVCVCTIVHVCTCICLPTVYISVSEIKVAISMWWLEFYDSTIGTCKGESRPGGTSRVRTRPKSGVFCGINLHMTWVLT